MPDLHDAAIQAGFRALSAADGFPGASYEGCMRDTNIIVSALAKDPEVRTTAINALDRAECILHPGRRWCTDWDDHNIAVDMLHPQCAVHAIFHALGGGDG